jgi:cyclopropane-fatty-acyl-phospholipid synthase
LLFIFCFARNETISRLLNWSHTVRCAAFHLFEGQRMMQRHESAPAGIAAPPIPFADTGAPEKWSAMEQRMTHPLLQSLRGVRRGTLRLYLPDGSEVFYLGADPGHHASMRFDDWKTLDRIALEGELALGEEYVAGRWTTADLRKLLRFSAQNNVFEGGQSRAPLSRLARYARRKISSDGSSRRKLHPRYDFDNEFYRLWLDTTMSFSGALFHGDNGVPLEEAQRAKYRRILGRLDPQRGEHVLDLGCGWGGFMEEAARLGIRVTGATLSAEQAAFAQHRLAGFAQLAEVRLEDYRRLDGKYDDIVSLGFFENIGEAHWADFMNCVFRNLKPGGRAMIQTTVIRDDLFEDYRMATDFAREHMTPGSAIPSRRRFEQAARRAGLNINDVCHFGRDQAITFDKWQERLDASMQRLHDMGYCDAFIRKWRFHLSGRAALFDARRLDVIQAELSKPRN